MQPVFDIIISDTSCLILLQKIEELELLKALGKRVFVTKDIKLEFGGILPSWIIVQEPKDQHYQRILELDLDKVEASAIALSLEMDHSIIILDDLKGRKIAEKLSLRYSGTLGLILRAKQIGALEKVKPILDKIRQTNFRFNESLLVFVMNESGEHSHD
jgi:predicted nucleic acid-binding protein